jgi:hypothetical protein
MCEDAGFEKESVCSFPISRKWVCFAAHPYREVDPLVMPDVSSHV